MGERAENWPPERLSGTAAFFSRLGYKSTAEWKEEVVFFDRFSDATDQPTAVFPNGVPVPLSPDEDPRRVFADWLITAESTGFTRNVVNRIWYWLLGRGIIHEVDDFRPDNPPSHPELLAYLEEELVAADYDLKHIYRLILNSTTYQLSCIPQTDRTGGDACFAYYPLRRLDAEVLIDALCQVTGSTEEYSSQIPEPFSFVPENQRSISLADGSISSSFLEMFGRPPRDTGLSSERDNQPSPAQRLHLLNSSHVQRKIEQSTKLRSLRGASGNPRESVIRLYLTILSRFPTEDELRALKEYADSAESQGQEVFVDLAWALINSVEFLYRH
jgi:hypothetical protein